MARFRAASTSAGNPAPDNDHHHDSKRSPSQSATATLSISAQSSQSAWLAPASAHGSSNNAHQANSSQVSAPVW
ncbi:Uncharacterised protein [Bordetella pertussis]|nr:Uncharacterised protein [Bordetella pertussis]CFP56947.1 Uncharacterised protein [Bordetella pertussis]CFT90310.1 Uncharacterised protein [Bordetella pertussis]CFV97372.1 Uncharacterised protein [Bordetella pertussis]CFW30577.1 Uncharacterised protein [Bordetella pertussis]